MAKRARPPGRRRKSQTAEAGPNAEKVKDYRHEEKRPNNPPAGLATYDKTLPSRKVYDYNPHLDPQLVWPGKKEHTSFEVESVALHIHERISTAAIVLADRIPVAQSSAEPITLVTNWTALLKKQ